MYIIFFYWAFNSICSRYLIIKSEASGVYLALFIKVRNVFSLSLKQFLDVTSFSLVLKIIPQLTQIAETYIFVCVFFLLFFSLTPCFNVFHANISLLPNAITVPLINIQRFYELDRRR